MLKHVSVFVLLSAFAFPSIAQLNGNRYDKLFDLYIMGDYEKCIKKSERLTEKDATRRDPEPYLYLSMSYYKVSLDRELEEYYPRALKNALRHAYKFVRKDDEGTLKSTNQDYLNELTQTALEEASYQYNMNKYRKAAYYVKKIMKYEAEAYGLQVYLGVAQVLSRNRRTGLDNITAGLDSLKVATKAGEDLKEYEAAYFSTAIVDYATYLEEDSKIAEAQTILEKGRFILPENQAIKKALNEYASL